MRKITLFILAFAMAFALAACVGDDLDRSTESESTQITDPNASTTELTVWGMVCTRCENRVKNALSDLDGVIDVLADYRADTVTVVHDPQLDVDTLKSAITREGFNIP